MNKKTTISKKITFGFACGLAMTIACGVAGYYASIRHKEAAGQLGYIVETAWPLADNTMDGTILIEAEMLAVQNILNNHEVEKNENQIEETDEASASAFRIVRDSGVIDSSKFQRFEGLVSEYREALDSLLSTNKAYMEKESEFRIRSDAFIELSHVVEELGDGGVQELKANPKEAVYWEDGLEERWMAADGGMMSLIGFLQQQYHVEQLTKAGAGKIESLQQLLKEDLAYQKEAMDEMLSTGRFDVPLPGHNGEKVSEVYRKAFGEHEAILWEMVDLIVAKKTQEASYLNQAEALLGELESLEAEVDAVIDSFDPNVGQISLMILSITGLSILVAVLSGGITFRSIVGPIKKVSLKLDRITKGSLSTAAEVSGSSRELAETSSTQAAAIEETRSSIEQISCKTEETAKGSVKATTLSKETRQAAELGASEMENMCAAMDDIRTSSSEISHIIKTIDEIAFQTNILALNAAVEAARAGDAGAGFAVVADEVRALALRSATAAQETASLIEGAVAKSQTGVQMSNRMADGLREIVQKAQTLDELVEEISSLSLEQKEGISQISEAILSLDSSVQRNAANADNNSRSAESLESQSRDLQEAVGEVMAMFDKDATATSTPPFQLNSGSRMNTGFDSSDDLARAFPRSVASEAEIFRN